MGCRGDGCVRRRQEHRVSATPERRVIHHPIQQHVAVRVLCRQHGPLLTQSRRGPACCISDAPSRAMEGEGVTNPRDGREGASAAATARAAHGAASGVGAAASQGVSSGSPPSPRGGVLSRMWETLSGSPKASSDAQLSTSPPSPGALLRLWACRDAASTACAYLPRTSSACRRGCAPGIADASLALLAPLARVARQQHLRGSC